MIRKLLCHSLIYLILFTVTRVSLASVNPDVSPAVKPGKPPAVAALASKLTDAEIDTIRAQLDARVADIRMKVGPEALAALRNTYQDTATPEELEEWEKLTRKLASILEEH